VLGRRRRGARDDVLRAKPEPAIVDLGSISCPSGELVLVDATYLNMWSGERSPGEINLHIEDEALAAGFAAAIDLDVDGPDAMEAVKALWASAVGSVSVRHPRTRRRGHASGLRCHVR